MSDRSLECQTVQQAPDFAYAGRTEDLQLLLFMDRAARIQIDFNDLPQQQLTHKIAFCKASSYKQIMQYNGLMHAQGSTCHSCILANAASAAKAAASLKRVTGRVS